MLDFAAICSVQLQHEPNPFAGLADYLARSIGAKGLLFAPRFSDWQVRHDLYTNLDIELAVSMYHPGMPDFWREVQAWYIQRLNNLQPRTLFVQGMDSLVILAHLTYQPQQVLVFVDSLEYDEAFTNYWLAQSQVKAKCLIAADYELAFLLAEMPFFEGLPSFVCPLPAPFINSTEEPATRRPRICWDANFAPHNGEDFALSEEASIHPIDAVYTKLGPFATYPERKANQVKVHTQVSSKRELELRSTSSWGLCYRPDHDPRVNSEIPTELAQYLACGTPVIASDCGMFAQWVRQFDCGILIEVDKPGEVHRAITHAMSLCGTARHAQLTANCRSAWKKIAFDTQASQLFEDIKSLLAF